MFNRALRSVAIAVAVGIPVIWIAWGWRSMLLFLVGSAIAATGILEWRQLMSAVITRLDLGTGSPRAHPSPWGAFCSGFLSGSPPLPGVLYVSLRSLDGKVAALLIGLALALAALFIEALRLLRVAGRTPN